MSIFIFNLPGGAAIPGVSDLAPFVPLGGYGIDPYGTSLYGDASPTIAIAAAYAIDTNTIRVILSSEPMHVDSFRAGDALNPATWSIIRNDTGAQFTILGIIGRSESTFDLHVLEALGSRFVSHTVTTTTLLSILGYLINGATAANLLGVVEQHDPLKASALEPYRDRDLRNPPFATGGLSGCLVFAADSDYQSEDRASLVKKCCMRRLGTKPNGFKHLGKDYGVGILEKEPIPGGSLSNLKATIERQLQLEPDVETVKANLLLDRSGVLLIQFNLIIAGNGAELNFGIKVHNQTLVEL